MKIPDIKEIAVAWIRAANPTEEQARIAQSRMAICDSCVHKEFRTLTRTYVCNACGCPLQKKVFTPKGASGCPKKYWTE